MLVSLGGSLVRMVVQHSSNFTMVPEVSGSSIANPRILEPTVSLQRDQKVPVVR